MKKNTEMPATALKRTDETLDTVTFHGKEVSVCQKVKGYRFSLDSVLLADFVRRLGRERVVDLGTGSGIIALLLAKRFPSTKVWAVELQPSLADMAHRNIMLNGLEDRMQLVEADVAGLKKLGKIIEPGSIDRVVCNPPYRKSTTGLISPDDERAVARHEIRGGIDVMAKAARYLLKNGGFFNVIYLASRLSDLIDALRREKLEPKRIRFIHSYRDSEAKMVMVEAKKEGGRDLKVLPPLYVYERGKDYSEEVLGIFGKVRPQIGIDQ
ncbi:MAG: tRNA1(Val) (adenine(37)-N6)-methyltransferase [Nitrospirota bacterium]|nr:tRNA1(Val) (adenine(37)-N6)-methyltransferase [Nitrospirota bacterium]